MNIDPSKLKAVFGKGQLYLSIIGMVGLAISTFFTIVASQSCTGLGCTSALVGLLGVIATFSISLLAIPAYGWLKDRSWALVVNLVLLLPLAVVAAVIVGIGSDIATHSTAESLKSDASKSHWSAVTRSTVDSLVSEIRNFEFGIQRVPGNELLWRVTPRAPDFRLQPKAYQLVTENEAAALVHYLADDGFFDRLQIERTSPFVPPPGSYALIYITNGTDVSRIDRVPWTTSAYNRYGSMRPPISSQLEDLKALVHSPAALASIEAVQN